MQFYERGIASIENTRKEYVKPTGLTDSLLSIRKRKTTPSIGA